MFYHLNVEFKRNILLDIIQMAQLVKIGFIVNRFVSHLVFITFGIHRHVMIHVFICIFFIHVLSTKHPFEFYCCDVLPNWNSAAAFWLSKWRHVYCGNKCFRIPLLALDGDDLWDSTKFSEYYTTFEICVRAKNI